MRYLNLNISTRIYTKLKVYLDNSMSFILKNFYNIFTPGIHNKLKILK